MSARSATIRQLRLPLLRDLPETEQGFVVSACNRAAHDLISRWPNGVGGVLCLCGPAGSGKSHLARVWTERVGAFPILGVEAALADPLELEGRPLTLDQAEEADDETLFHLINLALSGGGAMLMVSRAAPVAWKAELPDLRSRLGATLTVALEEPDEVVIAAVLRARFAERGLRAPDEVVDYLTLRIPRSAAAAAAVVDRLDQMNRPLNRLTAKAVLDESGELFE